MAAACWQFFKESVCRLTGMNDPLPCRSPFFFLKLTPFASDHTREKGREKKKKRERERERADHATAQNPPVTGDGFCVQNRAFLYEKRFSFEGREKIR